MRGDESMLTPKNRATVVNTGPFKHVFQICKLKGHLNPLGSGLIGQHPEAQML